MMKNNAQRILIIYKSSTGFTKRYAELLAEKLDCPVMDIKAAQSAPLSGYDIIIFGTRAHAGTIDGLRKLRKILQKHGRSAARGLNLQRDLPDILFVTGAAPAEDQAATEGLWQDNLTAEELARLPHFYLPAGLCYEKMTFTDRMMMKGLSFMMKHKKDKTGRDIALERQIAHSFDISSETYLKPVADCISRLR